MKRVALTACVLAVALAGWAATNDSEIDQWQRIYERVKTEWGMGTNLDAMDITNVEQFSNNFVFKGRFVHPAFGIYWEEIPPPTLTNSSAINGVNAFIGTNGWNMHAGSLEPIEWVKNQESIRGLPWKEIHDREFMAFTHNEILYVGFTGWHFNEFGVAFNPKTNAFPWAIQGFKSLGSHWYSWARSDDGARMTQIYEGQKIGEEGNAANGSQLIHSGTNSTSSQ